MKIAIRNVLWIASMVFAVTAWGQSASVTVGSGQGLPGATGIVIPVNLTAGQDIAGIEMTVTFTTAAQYSAIVKDCSLRNVSSDLFDSCSVTGNVVKISIADTQATTWVDGLLANITVDVDGAATPMVDSLVAVVISAGNTAGLDLSPLPTATNGTFTVLAGPQPLFTGTAVGLQMATEQGLADPTGSVTVTNTGATGSLLTGTCSLDGMGAPQISMSNGVFTDIAVGAAGSVVGITCDASTAGKYAEVLTCDHNGSNGPSTVYAVNCDIAPPGSAVYNSTPATGATIEMTPAGDVPKGATVPDQTLTISNGATATTAYPLALTCVLAAGSGDITVKTAPTSPVLPNGSTTAVFGCSAATVAAHTGAYSCSYDVDGDGADDGKADYTVNCGVRVAASDILEAPLSGNSLFIPVPVFGTGQTSVAFNEILDEGVDTATVDTCSFGTANFAVVTTLPDTVTAGGSLTVTVSGTDPGTGEISFTDTLTCTYTDSDSNGATVSWPITMLVQSQVIPTLSTWGLMLMILTLMGLGGIVIRRKKVLS